MRSSLIFPLLFVALTAVGLMGYRSETAPERLFYRYFDPTPLVGYGNLRAANASAVEDGTEASLLRQLTVYHREGRFDFALTSFAAWRESEPLTDDFRPYALAVTAALASGRDAEARHILREMPVVSPTGKSNRNYLRGMLAVKEGDHAAAVELLGSVEGTARSERIASLLRELAAED